LPPNAYSDFSQSSKRELRIDNYHCSTQVQSGSMHSAPADVGDE